MKITVTLTQQEMIDVLKKYYSTQCMTEVDVVLLPTEREESKSALWYPDNSGEWIESGFNIPLGLSTQVQTLTKSERQGQWWNPCIRSPQDVSWSDVVAYKIVKEMKSALWYPDNSSEWIECDGKKPSHLPKVIMVQTLSRFERSARTMCDSRAKSISEWKWDNVVAYKIVN